MAWKRNEVEKIIEIVSSNGLLDGRTTILTYASPCIDLNVECMKMLESVQKTSAGFDLTSIIDKHW